MLMKVSLGTMVVKVGQRGSKSNFLEGIVVVFLDIYRPIYRWDSNLMSNRGLLGNHGLKMFDFRDIRGKSKR